MKRLIKLALGVFLFFMFIGGILELTKSDEEVNLDTIKLAVRMDLEDIAKRTLRNPSTFKSSSFFMADSLATLYYSGANAFGVESTESIKAKVKYDIETTKYSVKVIK